MKGLVLHEPVLAFAFSWSQGLHSRLLYKISETELILQDLEQQQQAEADLAREKVEELESVLEDEKRKREACEQQIQQHLQVKTVNAVYFFLCQKIRILTV